MIMNQRKFYLLLNKYIKKANITDTALAKHVSVAKETVFRWKNGAIAAPREKTIYKFKDILQLNDEELSELIEAARDLRYIKGKPSLFAQRISPVIRKKVTNPVHITTKPLVPVFTRPIEHPQSFFGQHQVITQLVNYWNRVTMLEHVLITAPRKGGKTSLLNYLRYLPDADTLRNNQIKEWFNQPIQWVYVDFSRMEMGKLSYLLRYLADEIDLAWLDDKNVLDFTMLLEEHLRQQAKPLIMLFDNIDQGYMQQELLPFWSVTRSWSEFSYFALCGTSREPVYRLREKAAQQNLVSIFSNDAASLELSPFTEEEARELLQYAQVSWTEDDYEWIAKMSHYWPVLLQLICDMRIRFPLQMEWRTKAENAIAQYTELLQPINT